MEKYKKNESPKGITFTSLSVSGPVAKKDGEFEGTKLSDFGCFTQDGKDSNKFYFACVCSGNNRWFTYFEWGRVGSLSDFQFIEYETEQETIKAYEKQCHAKNDKRGEWFDHPVLGKILRAKKGKDCYLVQEKVERSTRIPAANSISNAVKVQQTNSTKLHTEIFNLLSDLYNGTVDYAKSSIVGGNVPSISSIEYARNICALAAKTKDKKELEELTAILYSKIPKYKSVGTDCTLSKSNIVTWLNDLDAYESAIDTPVASSSFPNKIEVNYLNKQSKEYGDIKSWLESSTKNRHSYIPSAINVINIYKLEDNHDLITHIQPYSNLNECEKPFNYKKFDYIDKVKNVFPLIHGTRTVNVGGILKSGFRLPKELSGVAINGSNYGAGIYHADDYKKSAGYTSIKNSYWSRGSGSISNRQAFLFIDFVFLGNPYIPNRGNSVYVPPNGYHSIAAIGGKSGVENNEYVVFDTKQVKMSYLVEFSI